MLDRSDDMGDITLTVHSEGEDDDDDDDVVCNNNHYPNPGYRLWYTNHVSLRNFWPCLEIHWAVRGVAGGGGREGECDHRAQKNCRVHGVFGTSCGGGCDANSAMLTSGRAPFTLHLLYSDPNPIRSDHLNLIRMLNVDFRFHYLGTGFVGKDVAPSEFWIQDFDPFHIIK